MRELIVCDMQAPQESIRKQELLDITSLYRMHAPFVGRVIQKLAGHGDHVADLLQETFIVAFKRQNEFSGKSSAETWLYGIAANLCLHHHRSRGRFAKFQVSLAQHPETKRAMSPSETLEQQETILAVQRVLQKLPFKQREVVVLYELEHKEGSEIAEMVGAPIGTVWRRLHDGRTTFKKLMRKELAARRVP